MPERREASARQSRSVGRLAAVQALYQMEIAATDLTDILAERSAGAVGREVEGTELARLDFDFFRDVIEGVVREQARLDTDIDKRLAEGWTLGRVDATLRAILRAGTYELWSRRDVPYKVTITEYVDIAHAFFDGPEPKVVNGVLDRLAHDYQRDVPAFDEGP